MPVTHKLYPKELIYVGGQGEGPKAGSFYVPKYGDSLIKISIAAYGVGPKWTMINSNPWNADNLVYRATSSSCKSAKVSSGSAAKTFNPSGFGAFIALCPKDRKDSSFEYPVIWIPSLKKPMPSTSVEEQRKFVINTTTAILPHRPTGKPSPSLDEGVITQDTPAFIVRLGKSASEAVEPVSAEVPESGIPWWGYAIAVVAGAVAIWKIRK